MIQACGRAESTEGLGEFRATLFGSICQTVTCVPSDWHKSPSNCLKLCCPDRLNLRWSARYFEEYFNEQCSALHLLAYQGTRSLVRMGSRADVEWVDPEGNINVFLKPLTTVFREMEGQIGDVDELKKLDSLARRCGLQMLKFHEDTVCGHHQAGESRGNLVSRSHGLQKKKTMGSTNWVCAVALAHRDLIKGGVIFSATLPASDVAVRILVEHALRVQLVNF
ncbi:hypothetical protein FB451DRAFT_1170556 [Mycena latifolia]|nr:hypothetical protein FB451DRAFT_1170556 [Mycena latifolia]